MIAGLVDQHVTTLASANPVDVVSSDRHTVKPWFLGRLSFTFNLPELANSPYTLLGGKMAYIQQNPGAELLYQAGQHKITVYIFQATARSTKPPAVNVTFNVKSWRQGGLQFYMVTDASDNEAGRLMSMLQEANRRNQRLEAGNPAAGEEAYCFPVGRIGPFGAAEAALLLETKRLASFHVSPSFFHKSTTKNSPPAALPL